MLSAVMQRNDQRMKLNVRQHKFLEKKHHTVYKSVTDKTWKVCSTYLLVSCQLGYWIWFGALNSRIQRTLESEEKQRLSRSREDMASKKKT